VLLVPTLVVGDLDRNAFGAVKAEVEPSRLTRSALAFAKRTMMGSLLNIMSLFTYRGYPGALGPTDFGTIRRNIASPADTDYSR